MFMALKKYNHKPEHYVTLSMNPGYAGRSPMPAETWRDWTAVHFVSPDIRIIVSVMMYTEGMGNKSWDLGAKLVNTITELKDNFKLQWLDLGLRAIKEVTR